MKPTIAYEVETFPYFDKKSWLAEAILEGIRCRLYRNKEGKVSLVTEDNQDITDRFIGIFYDDAERLHDTEIEGTLMVKNNIEYMDKEIIQDTLKYDKEGIEKIFKGIAVIGWKLVFVATDIISFLGDNYTQIGYETRKLKVEDVLICIDNTFEMKYKDYYTLCHPLENTKESFFKVFERGYKGMSFKNVSSKYEGGISEDYVELYGVTKPENE